MHTPQRSASGEHSAPDAPERMTREMLVRDGEAPAAAKESA